MHCLYEIHLLQNFLEKEYIITIDVTCLIRGIFRAVREELF
jgi:general stress protein CsbA